MSAGKYSSIQIHLLGTEQFRTQGGFVFKTSTQNGLASNTFSQMGEVEPRGWRTNLQWLLHMRDGVPSGGWTCSDRTGSGRPRSVRALQSLKRIDVERSSAGTQEF